MWAIYYFPPGKGRRRLEGFGTRGEAEGYRAKFQRLLGSKYTSVVAFEIPVVPEVPEVPGGFLYGGKAQPRKSNND